MQKKDLEIVNNELSKISDKILKVLEILQDEKLTHKQARKDAECEIDNLLYEIPVFMEVNGENN